MSLEETEKEVDMCQRLAQGYISQATLQYMRQIDQRKLSQQLAVCGLIFSLLSEVAVHIAYFFVYFKVPRNEAKEIFKQYVLYLRQEIKVRITETKEFKREQAN